MQLSRYFILRLLRGWDGRWVLLCWHFEGYLSRLNFNLTCNRINLCELKAKQSSTQIYEMKSGQTKNREKCFNTLPRRYLHLSRRNFSSIPVLRYCHHYSTIFLSPRMTIFLYIFTFAVTIVIKCCLALFSPLREHFLSIIVLVPW